MADNASPVEILRELMRRHHVSVADSHDPRLDWQTEVQLEIAIQVCRLLQRIADSLASLEQKP